MSMTDEERTAIVTYRLEKSENTFADVLKSLEYEMYNTCANRLYYSFYYAASALLIKKGIIAHTHSGVLAMINLHFVKTGVLSKEDAILMRRLFSLRQESDYDDFINITIDDIKPLIEPTRKLIQLLTQLCQ